MWFSKRPQDTLDLMGDLDDVEILEWAEDTFGIALNDQEVWALVTVGDLHALICRKAGLPAEAPCYSARYFRALRAAAPEGLGRLRPSTPLSDISTEALVELERRAGVRLAVHPHPVRFWAIAASLILPGILAGAVHPLMIGLYALAVPITLHLTRELPTVVPPRLRTFGELVRETADANVARFAARGHKVGAKEAWRMLCRACSDISGHDRPITPNTTFFAQS